MTRGLDTPRVLAALDVGQGSLLEDRAAHDPGVGGGEEQDQHQDRHPEPPAEHPHHDDGDEQTRERQHQVGPSHDEPIGRTTEVAGGETKHGGNGKGPDGDGRRPDERCPGADDRSREHVSTELVGAGPELCARRGVADEQTLLFVIVRCQEGAKHGEDEQQGRGTRATAQP